MKDYLQKLLDHPGLPLAAVLSVAGGLAGLAGEMGFWFGFLVMSVAVWLPVLITAAYQPRTTGKENE
jgi:hypothetical protein